MYEKLSGELQEALERALAIADELGLSLVAIKAAEALDHLRLAQEQSSNRPDNAETDC